MQVSQKSTRLSVLALLFMVGCGPTSQNKLADLVADRSATNIALILGATNGLPGLATDIANMQAIFSDPNLNLGFQVQVVREVTTTTFLSSLTQGAQQVGETGTLLVWYGGHGASGTGDLYLADQRTLKASAIMTTLQNARATPMKRFIFLNDSCFSGNFVNGTNTMIAANGSTTGGSGMALYGDDLSVTAQKVAQTWATALTQPASSQGFQLADYPVSPFEQGLVFTASSRSESALDMGPQQGSTFTGTLTSVFRELKQTGGQPLVRQLLESVTEKVSSRYGHTPAYRYIPTTAIAEEPLFSPSAQVTASAPPAQPAATPTQPPALGVGLLIEQAAGETVHLWAGVPLGTSQIIICKGDSVSCSASKRNDHPTIASTPAPARGYFRTQVALTPTSEVYTFLVIDQAGNISGTRSVRLVPVR